MLNLNDDNNDELFRRAAENYPVKTDSSNWEAVRTKMDAALDEPKAAVVPNRKKYRALWLLLLLLIPMAILENKYKIIGKSFIAEKKEASTTAQDQKTNSNTSNTTTGSLQKAPATVEAVPGTVSPNTTIDAAAPIQPNASTINTDTKEPAKINNKKVIVDKVEAVDKADNARSAHKRPGHSNQRTNINIQNASLATDDDAIASSNDISTKKHITRSDKKKQQTTIKAAEAVSDEPVADAGKNNKGTKVAVDKVEDVDKDKNDEAINNKKTSIVKDEDKTKEEEKPIVKTDSAAKKQTQKEIVKTDTKTGKKENNKDKKPKHFYIGLMAGPDFSAIKLQSVKKTGINYGFLAGYKINKWLSVETGIFKDKKFYSTKGEYFSTKNIYLPPNATVEYVDGECNMLEVPINFTYTFRQKARSVWFATAGVSSYFMKDESYVYDILHNGYRYPYSYKYKNKNTALLAVINFSAGYTYKLGKIADLRIEPYIKLPVNKVGTGKLPIQSVGIMVGLTKTIF